MSTRLIRGSDNVAEGIAQWVIDFLKMGNPDQEVIDRTVLFRQDALACGLSALALGCNAPKVLRNAAMMQQVDRTATIPGTNILIGAPMYGARYRFYGPAAARAGTSADREWDSNGTNFGYDPERNNIAGEFGHNDFYPAVEAAAMMAGNVDGRTLLLAYIAVDTVRGRLAEVFSLKTYKIDHTLYGAMATAAVATALWGGSVEQVARAISAVLIHATPWRAIRAGKQLSDSKGASAGITTGIALDLAVNTILGFKFPTDGINNPQAIFCLFEGETAGCAPFDVALPMSGNDFPIMGMHFKMGLYEHQSAGALHGLFQVLTSAPHLLENDGNNIRKIEVGAYEPAFSIIGDPAKRTPTTRQSADHSMVFILGRTLSNAIQRGEASWLTGILLPDDYTSSAISDPNTRRFMGEDMMSFVHDESLDPLYPGGIPSWIKITDSSGAVIESGNIEFPLGHAKNQGADCLEVLRRKHAALLNAAGIEPSLLDDFSSLEDLKASDLFDLYDIELTIPESDFDEVESLEPVNEST